MSVACLGKCYAVWGHDEIGDTIRQMPACPLSVLLSLANRVPLFHVSKRCLYHSSIILSFFFFINATFLHHFLNRIYRFQKELVAQHSNTEKSREHKFFYFVLFLRKCEGFFCLSTSLTYCCCLNIFSVITRDADAVNVHAGDFYSVS